MTRRKRSGAVVGSVRAGRTGCWRCWKQYCGGEKCHLPPVGKSGRC